MQFFLIVVIVNFIAINIYNFIIGDNAAVAFVYNISNVEIKGCKTDHNKTENDTDNTSAFEWIEYEEYAAYKKNYSEYQLQYLHFFGQFFTESFYDLRNSYDSEDYTCDNRHLR